MHFLFVKQNSRETGKKCKRHFAIDKAVCKDIKLNNKYSKKGIYRL